MHYRILNWKISAAALCAMQLLSLSAEAKDGPFSTPICPVLEGHKHKPLKLGEPVKLETSAPAKLKFAPSTNFEQAKNVSLVPAALIPNEKELDEYREASLSQEKKEIIQLWDATISRSPDIQFVINIMQPTTDRNHVASTAARYLSTAVTGTLSAASAFTPFGTNVAGNVGTGMGAGVLRGILDKFSSDKAHQKNLSEQEIALMFKMVRDVADRLVEDYRNYKIALNSYDSSCEQLTDMQTLISVDNSPSAADKLLDRQFDLRQFQRNVKECEDRVELHRRQLLDLAGSDAVMRLDDQIIEGRIMLARMGVPTGRPLLIPTVRTVETPTTP